jgi:hypothetical protein
MEDKQAAVGDVFCSGEARAPKIFSTNEPEGETHQEEVEKTQDKTESQGSRLEALAGEHRPRSCPSDNSVPLESGLRQRIRARRANELPTDRWGVPSVPR